MMVLPTHLPTCQFPHVSNYVGSGGGQVYGIIVRRCLHCTFDVTIQISEMREFTEAVYVALKPLLRILQSS